jgi:hypothetical protein
MSVAPGTLPALKPITAFKVTATTPDGDVAIQSLSAARPVNGTNDKGFYLEARNESYPKEMIKHLAAGDGDAADMVFPKFYAEEARDVQSENPQLKAAQHVLSAFDAAGMLSPSKIVTDGLGWQKPDTVVLTVSNASEANPLAYPSHYRWNLSELTPTQSSAVDFARLAVSELTKDSKNQATTSNKIAATAAMTAANALIGKLDDDLAKLTASMDADNPYAFNPQ